MNSITSEDFSFIGKKLSNTSNVTLLIRELNNAFNSFLGWPYIAASGCITDSENQKSDDFGTIIYVSSAPNNDLNEKSIEVSADMVSCYIDVSDNLNLDKLRESYSRIAFAKKLKKTTITHLKGTSVTSSSLGIIFANTSSSSLEELADELERLNKLESDVHWPNMVVVLSKGIISYTLQLPGETSFADLLPPDEGILNSVMPAIYIVMVLYPAGIQTFNKMCALIIAQLNRFNPGSILPDNKEVLKNCPKFSVVKTGYQYNLHGNLCPVPSHLYNGNYLPQIPLRIEDHQGNILARLQFVPWQDSGVLLLRGKLPLESMIILLGLNPNQSGSIIKRNDLQISYILPITLNQVNMMLRMFQQHSNMVVRTESENIIKQQIFDEGTQSPFIARLFIGILKLRDSVLHDISKKNEFDKIYSSIIDTLFEIRTTKNNIIKLIYDHFDKISRGEITHAEDQSIRITESIDRELKKQIESFINSSTRVLKYKLQQITKILDIDIAFLYQKEPAFQNGLALIEKSDPNLAKYLTQIRIWSNQLVELRNDLEHDRWSLPKIKYSNKNGFIKATEPQILNFLATDFIKFITNRYISFVEEIIVYSLQKMCPSGISFMEIPLQKRNPDLPIRFQISLEDTGLPIWTICYEENSFEEK